jgi:hypothetical protein
MMTRRNHEGTKNNQEHEELFVPNCAARSWQLLVSSWFWREA